MTNWPNTIQCLGSDDIMSLGIKSSAFLRVEHPRKFDMSSTSGYMGEKYVQEFGLTYMPVLCQEYMLFFCLPLSSQPRLRLLRPLSISQHISAYSKNKGGAGESENLKIQES